MRTAIDRSPLRIRAPMADITAAFSGLDSVFDKSLRLDSITKPSEESPEPQEDNQQQLQSLTLEQLVDAVESYLKQDDKATKPFNKRAGLQELLQRYNGDPRELARFALTDTSKNYTRNLVSTDNETYAMILIVWNRGKYSPIHDHPCDGCWVKVISGAVNEVRYEKQGETLVETSNIVLNHGVTYMDDSLGLHKIGNPSDSIDGITLHIYSPPFDKCRVWFDPTQAAKSSVAYAYYYSEYGEKADY